MTTDDKRKENRLPFSSSAFIEKEYFGGSDDALVVNVSTNGLSLQTTLSFAQDEYVSVQIENPKTFEKIRLLGEVSWVDQTDKNTMKVGVELAPMDKALQAKYIKLLEIIDTGYEPTNPKSSFAGQDTLQAEIEKILQITPLQEAEPTLVTDEKKLASQTASIPEFTSAPITSTKPRKNPLSLFTILLLIFLALSIGTYFLNKNSDKPLTKNQITSKLRKENMTPVVVKKPTTAPKDGSIAEMSLNEQGEVIPEKKADKKTEGTITQTETFPYHSAFEFKKGSWITQVSSTGNDDYVLINWSFAEKIDASKISVQKLDFDKDHIRYLVRLPAPGKPLETKEIDIEHPLATKARLGLHGSKKEQLHIVFDVTHPDTKLTHKMLSPKVLEIRFQ